ncbi:MAG: MBG domain-containing protein, partial [Oscillospiraceae bacterium]
PSTTFGKLEPNTEYFFFARVKESTNHPAGAASIGTPITTAKKVFEETEFHTPENVPVKGADLLSPRSFLMANNAAKTATLAPVEALGGYMPAGAAFTKVTGPAEPLVMKSVGIDEKSGELVFTSKKNPVGFAATDVYTIIVSSQDYQNFAFTMGFSASEKMSVVVTATMDGKVYDGNQVGEPTPSAKVGNDLLVLQYTYQWKQGNMVLDAAPCNAGDYTLVINGSNDNFVGSLTLPFTIEKKPLTVTAGNAAVVSGAAPEFTFTSAGLVTGETLIGVGYDCTYDKAHPDPGMARTAIIPHGGTVSSGNDNYAIS